MVQLRPRQNNRAITNVNAHTFGPPPPPPAIAPPVAPAPVVPAPVIPAPVVPAPPPPPPPTIPLPQAQANAGAAFIAGLYLAATQFVALLNVLVTQQPLPAAPQAQDPAGPATDPADPAANGTNNDENGAGHNDDGTRNGEPVADDHHPGDGEQGGNSQNEDGGGEDENVGPEGQRNGPNDDDQEDAPARDDDSERYTPSEKSSKKRRSQDADAVPGGSRGGSNKRPRTSPGQESGGGPDSSQQMGGTPSQDLGSDDSGDTISYWPEQWETFYGHFKAHGANGNQREEFKAIFTEIYGIVVDVNRVREQVQNDESDLPDDASGEAEVQIPEPNLWLSQDTPAEYLARLRDDMRKTTFPWCVFTWDKAIAQISGAQRRNLLLQKAEMIAKFNAGEWPETRRLGIAVPPINPSDLATRLKFDTQPTDPEELNGPWEFDRKLGEGAYGCACVWRQTDANNNLVKSMVTKDAYFSEEDWDGRKWFDKKYGPHGAPTEVAFQIRLNKLRDSINVVRCLGCRLNGAHRVCRMYQEYCPYGNLNEMMKKSKEAAAHVPPNMLWAIFEALVSVLCLMENGTLPCHERNPKDPKWKSILHLDIKPENIFLAPAQPKVGNLQNWPGCPTPKLGDFGLARFSGEGDPTEGTPGYIPPERNDLVSSVPEATIDSEIWSTARVLYSLMVQEPNTKRQQVDKDGIPEFPTTGPSTVYDEKCPKLVEKIKLNLNADPDVRDSVRKLWQDIQDHVAKPHGLTEFPIKLTPLAEGETVHSSAWGTGETFIM